MKTATVWCAVETEYNSIHPLSVPLIVHGVTGSPAPIPGVFTLDGVQSHTPILTLQTLLDMPHEHREEVRFEPPTPEVRGAVLSSVRLQVIFAR